MKLDRIFLGIAGTLGAVLISPVQPGTEGSTREGIATYNAIWAFTLQAVVTFVILGIAAWSWRTFNKGKKEGDTEPLASIWQRSLAAFGLVVAFVALLAGLASAFAR